MVKHDSPANFFLLYAANFFFSAAYFILFPIMPSYVHGIKAGVLSVLPVTIVYFLAMIITAPILGYFFDWKGRLRFALGGAFVSTVLAFLYILINNLALLFVVRFLHGVATAAFSAAVLTILTDATEKLWRGDIISSYLTPQLFWIAVGPAFALFLYPLGGTKIIFLTAGIFSLLAFIFTALSKRPKLFTLSKQKIRFVEFLYFDTILVLAAVFVFNAVYSALLLNIDKYLPKTQGDTLIGFYTWFVIAGLLAIYNTGNLSDKIGRGFAGFVGFAFLLISLVLILLTEQKQLASLAGVFLGIAYALIFPTFTAWWMDLAPFPKRGFYMGVFLSVQSLGMILGMWMLNIFGVIGPKSIFAAAFVIVLGVLMTISFRQWPELKAKFK